MIVKIGQTVNIKNRVCGMQSSAASLLEVIAFIPEPDVWRREELEAGLHRGLSRYQTRGEWFDFDAEGMDALAIAFGLAGADSLRPLQLTARSADDQATMRHSPTARPHTIAFRLNDQDLLLADSLRATFDPPTYSQAMRWILMSPEGRELIAKRVRGEV